MPIQFINYSKDFQGYAHRKDPIKGSDLIPVKKVDPGLTAQPNHREGSGVAFKKYLGAIPCL
jgi:hypothetical protein